MQKKTVESATVAKLSSTVKIKLNEYVKKQFVETVKLPAEYGKIASEINFSGYAILRTAYRTDAYCRAISGIRKRHGKPKDIKALLWALCERAKPFFEKNGFMLSSEFSKENLFASVDEEEFYYAVLELLLNAKENSFRGSKIKLSAKLAESCIKISVTNKGTGMDFETLANCFEPFFTTNSDRTGLGLTLVKNFADKNGGRVSVFSEKESKTRVSLYLPSVEVENPETAVKSPNAKILEGKFSPVDIMLSGIEKE